MRQRQWWKGLALGLACCALAQGANRVSTQMHVSLTLVSGCSSASVSAGAGAQVRVTCANVANTSPSAATPALALSAVSPSGTALNTARVRLQAPSQPAGTPWLVVEF